MTYIFVINALNHYATLLGIIILKERKIKIIFDFIVYFDMKYVTTRGYPLPP